MPRSKPRVLVRRRAATERQGDYLRALRELTDALNRGPTAAEVGRYVSPPVSRQGALKQLSALAAKGLAQAQHSGSLPPLWFVTEG